MKKLLFIALIFLMGCNQEDPIDDPSLFKNRDEVMRLENEPGRIKYYCGSDTSFFYLQADDPELPELVLDELDVFDTFFSLHWQGDVLHLLGNPCFIVAEDDIQDPELKVELSGSIKAQLPEDDFLVAGAAPFVGDNLVKVAACPVSYEQTDNVFPFHNTRWRVVEINNLSTLTYPTCEYNNILVTFTKEFVEGDRYVFEYHMGDESCKYSYVVVSGQELQIQLDECIPSPSNITSHMQTFITQFFEVLSDPGKTSGSFSYEMNGNILILNGGRDGTITLIGT